MIHFGAEAGGFFVVSLGSDDFGAAAGRAQMVYTELHIPIGWGRNLQLQTRNLLGAGRRPHQTSYFST